MMRLIDAERTVVDIKYQHKILQKMGLGELSDVLVKGFLQEIENQPTVDAEPVRHGRWVHGREVGREYIGDCLVGIFYDRWTCSECGYVVDDHKYSGINYKFCPNCGVKMDGGVDDG